MKSARLGVYATEHWWETDGAEVSKDQGKPQSKSHIWAGGELLFQEVRVFQGQERAQATAWKDQRAGTFGKQWVVFIGV